MAQVPRNSKPPSVKDARMPQKSTFYDRIVPAVLIFLGIVMFILILLSLGMLTGLVRWS